MGKRIVATAKRDILTPDVYAHDWGVLIPSQCGVVWEIQTEGVMCNHVHIEGVFIPLRFPKESQKKGEQMVWRNLLEELKNANYNFKGTQQIWSRIKNVMHFDFELIEAPKGQPESQEGVLWVKFSKFEGGWGHGAWVKQLMGKTVALIYPNCD